jgi:hypothetical protein
MVVRYKETNGRLDINIRDFINDCFEYKLPELLPQKNPQELKSIGKILHDNLMKMDKKTGDVLGDDVAKKALLAQGFDINDKTFRRLKQACDDILGGISGLGIDMLEPDAPERVLWNV